MMKWMQQANAIITSTPTRILDSPLARQPPASAVGSPHGSIAGRGQAEYAPVAGTAPALTEYVKAAWLPSHAPLGRWGQEVRSVLRSPLQVSVFPVEDQIPDPRMRVWWGIPPMVKSCPAPSPCP